MRKYFLISFEKTLFYCSEYKIDIYIIKSSKTQCLTKWSEKYHLSNHTFLLYFHYTKVHQFVWCKTVGRDIKIGDEKGVLSFNSLTRLGFKMSSTICCENGKTAEPAIGGVEVYIFISMMGYLLKTLNNLLPSRINFLEDCMLDHNQDQRGLSASW